MPNPVVHWEIVSTEANKLHGFYGEVFDWKIDANNPMEYGNVESNEGGGINGGIGPSPDGNNHVTFYIQVADLDAALKKIGSLGGKTVTPPTEIPGMVTLALFSDPAGNVAGMVKEGSGPQ